MQDVYNIICVNFRIYFLFNNELFPQLCRSEDVLDAIEQVQECITALKSFASSKIIFEVNKYCLLHFDNSFQILCSQ